MMMVHHLRSNQDWKVELGGMLLLCASATAGEDSIAAH
jgi:hypothetical protein